MAGMSGLPMRRQVSHKHPSTYRAADSTDSPRPITCLRWCDNDGDDDYHKVDDDDDDEDDNISTILYIYYDTWFWWRVWWWWWWWRQTHTRSEPGFELQFLTCLKDNSADASLYWATRFPWWSAVWEFRMLWCNENQPYTQRERVQGSVINILLHLKHC